MSAKPQVIEPEPQEVDVSDLLPIPGVVASGEAPGVPGVAESQPAPWPAGLPGNDEAEAALDSALDSTAAPDERLAPVARWICGLLADDDVKVMSGRWPGVDGGVLRRATAMRIRVGYATRSAPRAGAPSDAAAVSALLGEIDSLATEVAADASKAPDELAPVFQSLRHALVKDAIDFSEAAQRLVPREVAAAAPRPVRRAPRPATARVLSVRVGSEKGGDGRNRLLAAGLLLAIAAAATFHGYRHYLKVTAPPPPRPAGLPAGLDAMVVPGAGATMITPTSEPLDPAELDRFRADERAKGNELVELPGGGFLLKPAIAPGGGRR